MLVVPKMAFCTVPKDNNLKNEKKNMKKKLKKNMEKKLKLSMKSKVRPVWLVQNNMMNHLGLDRVFLAFLAKVFETTDPTLWSRKKNNFYSRNKGNK